MTADQMPHKIYIPEIGDDDYSQKIYYQTKGMGVEYIRADLAIPPKSQGVVWENVVELCHALTLARGIISVWCKDAPKENLSDWDRKWEASNKAVVTIQEATRQHTTPAQDELIQQAYLMGVLGSTNTPIPDDEKLRNAIIGFPRKADMADERILRWFRKHHEVLKHIMFHKAALSPTPAQAQGEMPQLIKEMDDAISDISHLYNIGTIPLVWADIRSLIIKRTE